MLQWTDWEKIAKQAAVDFETFLSWLIAIIQGLSCPKKTSMNNFIFNKFKRILQFWGNIILMIRCTERCEIYFQNLIITM